MKIEKFIVKNFRILKDVEICIDEELSVIIGKNNTGKTSFLTLLDMFFNKSSSFQLDDFNADVLDSILGLEKSNYDNDSFPKIFISLQTFISYDDTENIGNLADLILDLDSTNNYIVIHHKFELEYENYQKLMSAYNEQKGKVERSFQDFIAKNISRFFSLKVYAEEYSNEKNFKKIMHETVKNVISFRAIAAKRNVDNEQGRGKTLSKLANEYYLSQEKTDESQFSGLINELIKTDNALSKEYDKLFKDLFKEVNNLSYNPNEGELKVVSSLVEKPIFKENTTIKYVHGNRMLPEDYNGLGYLNLIAMVMDIRNKINGFLNKDNDTPLTPINLLFIEEPEAHTHPQMQHVFIRNIKDVLKLREKGQEDLCIQTIMSTHSAHIVAECDFQNVRYFHRISYANNIKSKNLRNLEGSIVKESSDETEQEKERQAYRFIKQYVNINRAEMFFADKIILLEGDTERMLITAMMKQYDENNQKSGKTDEAPLLSQNISIIETGAYAHIFANFLAFLDKKVLIITDLDCAAMNANNRLEKNRCSKATHTTNDTLKFFLKVETIKEILSKSADERTFFYCELDEKWEADNKGNLRLSYQNKTGNNVPRSFEEAFFVENMEFIIKNKDNFRGLKNRESLTDGLDTADYYDLANKCISKKSTFALDLLLYGYNEELQLIWKTPTYITEGLSWLAKQ